jgi:hypothetical protein
MDLPHTGSKTVARDLFLFAVSSYNTLARSLCESVSSSTEWTEGERRIGNQEGLLDFFFSSFQERERELKKFFHGSKISI